MSGQAMPWPWPAPVDDGAARHLTEGIQLPDIALAATRGPPVNLARQPGRAVVFVYPFTGTPGEPNPPDWDIIPGAHGSTPQAEGFRDHFAVFEARGSHVFGLSGQTSEAQRTFAMRLALPFPLLSDEHLAFADALRLPRFATGGVTYLKRITLLITDGTIERTIYPVHPPDSHAQELLESLF